MNTLTSKTIFIGKDMKPIRMEYSNNSTYFGDTAVTIYEDFKISLVLTDDCGAVIGDQVFFPKRGDMMIFRPNEIHFGRFPKSSAYKFISFLIPVDLFDSVFSADKSILAPFWDDTENKRNHIRLPEPEKSKLIAIAEDLSALMTEHENTAYFDVIVFAKLMEALDLCHRFYSMQTDFEQQASVPSAVTKTLRQIESRFPEFSGLDDLASHCGCSVTYLTQTFRRYMGKSIYRYLTERRLEFARLLLKQGASVTESCYQSGFSDCSDFIVLFKKHFHTTPGKYKKHGM